ncbi:hypothetical protein DEO72_LG2g163 [Vigna unguiculata]|uniref:Uncharacterized protein n=2 Tax=Vigna unguiculata TaxID=3917 RepID=A0A4D6KTL5_VIGUN|nr:hypothetical protein DEO72_LG2g163 [Vigna unguiculata]
MEQQQKTKRGRQEDDDESEKEWYENANNAKRRDVCGMKLMKEVEKEKEKEKEKEGCSSDAWESQLGLGVFDFPWLKDGVRCKSEEYFLGFEDNFSSLLEQEDASSKGSSVGLFETPEEKLEHIAWQPFESEMVEHEAEDVDCIWSSLLKHPL